MRKSLVAIRRWIISHAILSTVLAAAFAGVLVRCAFTVDVTEYAIVSRFGRITRVHAEPGLRLKWPHEQVIALSRLVQHTRPPPSEYLTTDKKNVVIQMLATWRIADPRTFLETVATARQAEARLTDAMVAQTGAILGNIASTALLAPGTQSSQYEAILTRIRDSLTQFSRASYGIDVLDMRFVDISLPEQNKESVFERMKAERGRIAKALRSAGELEAKKIIAAADRDKTRIEMEAYAKARLLKAEGDAQAARIYAAAFGRNPRFYKFTRTLQAYEKILDESTTLFLPANAEALSVLQAHPSEGVRR
jgi:membrane protease subunit HflC